MVEYKRVQSRPMELLLVEDNPADVELTQRALDRAEFHVNLTVAEDGEEALAILRKEDQFAQLPRPDLILLDLNMPNLNLTSATHTRRRLSPTSPSPWRQRSSTGQSESYSTTGST